MEYPLIIGGIQAGTANIMQDGLYTVVTAEAENAHDLTRLWLCGGGESFYLGIMEQRGSGMYFRKRFTKRESTKFPRNIDCLLDTEQHGQDEAENKAVNEAVDRIWYAMPDGSLVSKDGEKSLIALPSSIGHAVRGADIRMIEGKEYIIFRY